MVHKQHQQGRPEANNDQQMAAAAPKSYQESGELKKEIISKCFHSLKLGLKILCLFIRTAVKTFQDRKNF